ncbi:MAG TPA: DASS family sodium-coupled anion symporter [Candidatus Binatia bacterium]|nr:DASS family sodium-coupled anion symporter [Candidatus Binatia bacterium]
MRAEEEGGLEADGGFELWRRRAGLVLAPAAFALAWWGCAALDPPAHRLAAVLSAVVVLWMSEAIPMAMTAFLGVAAAVALGVAPASEAFAPFADPLIFLFIGTFMLAQAIFHHGLDRRFAFAILGLRGVGEHPGRVLAAYAAVTCFISMWISNTATVAMMYPIGLSVLAVLESHRGRAAPGYGAALLLAASFAASVGGLATPVGTPPNLIGIGFIRRETGVDLSFFSWMALGMPLSLLLLSWATFALWPGGARTTRSFGGLGTLVAAERRALGPWTAGQVNTMIAFGVTVTLWIVPGVVALVAGTQAPAYQRLVAILPEGVVALFGAGLLFVLPIDLRRHRFTLQWSEAVKIDWWIVFLYGGGIALGTLAFRTGLAGAMGRGLTEVLGVRSELGLLAASTAMAAVLSETTSNTASANMVVPVVIAFARSAGIDPVLPAVGATMGASLGFMLPVSTPCNAIVYGSGRIPLTTMMRYGIALDVAGVAATVLVVGALGRLVLGRG